MHRCTEWVAPGTARRNAIRFRGAALRGKMRAWATYLRPNQLRDLSITVGISRDIHFDYTEGRKGTEVVVDARQQSVLAGLSVEELRAIVAQGAQGGEGVTREADPPSPAKTGGPSRPDLKQIPTSSPYNDPPSLYGDPREAGVRST